MVTITNDTNTLNGALSELGETMAANLVAQGVSASASDGLTTLAGKILDISGGGSSFNGISLTCSKDVLSYVDSDSCIVSAQLTNEGSAVSVAGETVSFTVHKQSDDSLVETLQSQTTDASGSCSVTYYAKGTGDIYIKASCMSLTKTYSLTDAKYHTTDVSNWQTYKSQFKLSSYNVPVNARIIVKLNGNCQVAIGDDSTGWSDSWVCVLNTNGKFLYHSTATNQYAQADYTQGYEQIIDLSPTSIKLTVDGNIVFNQTGLVDNSNLPHTIRLYTLSQIGNVESITVL